MLHQEQPNFKDFLKKILNQQQYAQLKEIYKSLISNLQNSHTKQQQLTTLKKVTSRLDNDIKDH